MQSEQNVGESIRHSRQITRESSRGSRHNVPEAYVPSFVGGSQHEAADADFTTEAEAILSQGNWHQFDEIGGGQSSTQPPNLDIQTPEAAQQPQQPLPGYGGNYAYGGFRQGSYSGYQTGGYGGFQHGSYSGFQDPNYASPNVSQFATYPNMPASAFAASSRLPFAPSSSSSAQQEAPEEPEGWGRPGRLRDPDRLRGPQRYTPSGPTE